MFFVLGLILGTYVIILAPLLSSKTLHHTSAFPSGITTCFYFNSSMRFIMGIVVHRLFRRAMNSA